MNVGPVEIIIVLVLALLIFGPKQLPQMGRTLGKGLREFRHAADSARSELGLDDISAELGKVRSGLDALKADVDVKGAAIGSPPADAEDEGQPTEEVGFTKTPEAPIADDASQPDADDASQPDASTAPGA